MLTTQSIDSVTKCAYLNTYPIFLLYLREGQVNIHGKRSFNSINIVLSENVLILQMVNFFTVKSQTLVFPYAGISDLPKQSDSPERKAGTTWKLHWKP